MSPYAMTLIVLIFVSIKEKKEALPPAHLGQNGNYRYKQKAVAAATARNIFKYMYSYESLVKRSNLQNKFRNHSSDFTNIYLPLKFKLCGIPA